MEQPPLTPDIEAAELADKYVRYFDVNTEKQKRQLDDIIEELLSHLEEFCATLEIVRQHSVVCEPFVLKLVEKNKQIQVLYRQIDAIDDYLYDTMRNLDELNSQMKELQLSRTNETSSKNRFKQIFSRIPGLSSVPIPKVSLLTHFVSSDTSSSSSSSYNIISSNTTNNNENNHHHHQQTSYTSHLEKINEITSSFIDRTSELNQKISYLTRMDTTTTTTSNTNPDRHPHHHSPNSEYVDGSSHELVNS